MYVKVLVSVAKIKFACMPYIYHIIIRFAYLQVASGYLMSNPSLLRQAKAFLSTAA